ncbi:MAG: JAB domain-containing protein [Angelakisella sp.]
MTIDNKCLHEGHRERLKKRFRANGLESFELHNILELLLCYAIPRRDVNEEAHRLVDTFGTLTNVLDAPIEELLKVEGVSLNAATLLKIVPQLCRYYYEQKVEDAPLDSDNITDYLGKRLMASYISEINEVAYLICLDNRLRILYFGKLGEGTNDSVSILTRKIVEISIRCNASSVILAHNHPTGLAIPSKKDRLTTSQIYTALAGVSIKLLDHIVVARNEYSSMAALGMLSPVFLSAQRSGTSLGEEVVELPNPEDYDWRE